MGNNSGFLFESNSTKLKSKNFLTALIIYSIIITVLSIILAWMLIDSQSFAEKESSAKTIAINEKDNLLHKLKNMEMEYDELSREYQDLDSLFTEEKSKIKALILEINNLKGSANTTKYQATVTELEKRLKEYVAKIDELKAKNETLTAQSVKTKNTLDSTLNKTIELTQKNQELSEKIKTGTALKAYDITCTALRIKSDKKEAPTSLAKKTQKVRTCFTLSENLFTTKGYKVIYIRIADPDGAIMTVASETSSYFTFKGKSLLFSEKLEIYYNNKSEDVCIDWSNTLVLRKGIYYVDVFIDDNLLGTSTFSLN